MTPLKWFSGFLKKYRLVIVIVTVWDLPMVRESGLVV